MAARKKYSREFKLDAISLVIDQGYSKAEAARNLGINPNVLGRWIKEHENDDGHAFHGNGKLTPEQEELRRLREENKRLKMERDILKKATFFCHGIQVKYAFIAQHKKVWSIGVMCQQLGVTRSGY